MACSKDENECICNYVDYKYYKNEKDYLGDMSMKYINIGFDSSVTNNQIENFVNSQTAITTTELNLISSNSYKYPYKHIVVKLVNENLNCKEIEEIMLNIEKNSLVRLVDYTIMTDNCQSPIWQPLGQECVNYMGGLFYVNLKSINDRNKLDVMTKLTNTYIIDSSSYSNTYLIFADKYSKDNALKMANFFLKLDYLIGQNQALEKCPLDNF
jgi:hypothetical protein